MQAERSELNRNANTLLIQLENNLHSLTSWEHSAQVLNLFSWQHERILHQVAFLFGLHPARHDNAIPTKKVDRFLIMVLFN
jgi:hypothetical protein